MIVVVPMPRSSTLFKLLAFTTEPAIQPPTLLHPLPCSAKIKQRGTCMGHDAFGILRFINAWLADLLNIFFVACILSHVLQWHMTP